MLNAQPSVFHKVYFWALAVTVVLFLAGALTAEAQTPVTVGYRDFSYGIGTNVNATGEKPESKLWFNDGSWWGVLFNNPDGAHHIYQFDAFDRSWIDTGIRVDERNTSKSDCLWDEESQKLYVVSHESASTGAVTSSPGQWGMLYRFSYQPITQTYALDPAFPVSINNAVTETLTLAKDSTGTLWATWVQNNQVFINHSVGTNDADWSIPFLLPVTSSAVKTSSDDIASIVAFGGNKIGVMWSNQTANKFYFSVHHDGDEDGTWQTEESAYSGTNNTDDHINLKADSAGQVWAAVKTSRTSTSAPLIVLLKRLTSGSWRSYTVSTVRYGHTRPIVELNEGSNRVYVFMSAPTTGGKIYYKYSSLDSTSFTDGLGSNFIVSSTDTTVNDVSSSKQNFTDSTGLLVIASDGGTRYYLHNEIGLGPGAPEISSFTPSGGPSGTEVTINGSGFVSVRSVKFHGTSATTFSVISDTQLRAYVPSGATTGPISITTSLGTGYSSTDFVVQAATVPTIADFSPTSGPVGTQVTITGTSFLGTDNVSLGGLSIPDFTVISGTEIVVHVPIGARSGLISVTNSAGTATSTMPFTVLPAITSFDPTHGKVGTAVTISGTSFTEASSVLFSKTPAVFTISSDSKIVATVPQGATNGKLSVITPDGTATSATNFVVDYPPTITSFSPLNGPVGTSVTVYGSNLSGVTALAFHGISAHFSITTASEISTTVPTGATTGPITATNSFGTATSGADFTVESSSTGVTFTPSADSQVNSGNPTITYGSTTNLHLRTGDALNPITYRSYIRFTVSNFTGAVSSAKLRLWVTDATKNAVIVSSTSGSWVESTLNWNNAPQAIAQLAATPGASSGAWLEIVLPTSFFAAGNGTYNLQLQIDGSDSMVFSSRETSSAPQLVLR